MADQAFLSQDLNDRIASHARPQRALYADKRKMLEVALKQMIGYRPRYSRVIGND
jgi:hypothetical protein